MPFSFAFNRVTSRETTAKPTTAIRVRTASTNGVRPATGLDRIEFIATRKSIVMDDGKCWKARRVESRTLKELAASDQLDTGLVFVDPYTHATTESSEAFMPKYVIEREVPGAGKMTPDQLT